MPFLIVETIENNKKHLSVCPKNWVKNGILHWPKRKAAKKSKTENSLPEKDWAQMFCNIKRDAQTYEEAEKELAVMMTVSETEEEEGAKTGTTKSGKLLWENFNQRAQELNQSSAVKSASVVTNPNNAPCQILNIEYNQSSAVETATVVTNPNNAPYPLLNYENVHYYDVIPNENLQHQHEVEFHDENFVNSDIYLQSNVDPITKFNKASVSAGETTNSNILQNQKLILDNQIKICKFLAKLDVKIENLIRNSDPAPVKFLVNDPSQNIKISPIKDISELQHLENKLQDPETRKRLKDLYAVFCTPGKKGTICSYQLIDIFFSREFLINCSWSGSARGAGTKISIKLFQNILNLFFELVHDCDPSYTVDNNNDFFKNILKNSTKRLNAKLERTSTPRNSSKRRLGKTEQEDTTETKGKRTKIEDAGAKDLGHLIKETEKKTDLNGKQEEKKAQTDSKNLKKNHRKDNSNENKIHDDGRNYKKISDKQKQNDCIDDIMEEHENIDMETEKNSTDGEEIDVKKENKRQKTVSYNENRVKLCDGQNKEGEHVKKSVYENIDVYEVMEQIEKNEKRPNEKREKNKTEQNEKQDDEKEIKKKYQHIEVLQEHVIMETEKKFKKQDKKDLKQDEKPIKKRNLKNIENKTKCKDDKNKEGGNEKKSVFEDIEKIKKPEKANQGKNENYDKNQIVDRSGQDETENKESEKENTDGERDESDDGSYENEE